MATPDGLVFGSSLPDGEINRINGQFHDKAIGGLHCYAIPTMILWRLFVHIPTDFYGAVRFIL